MSGKNNLQKYKQYICNICLESNKEDLISVLNFLKKHHIDDKLLNQNNDGIKIDLDKLDDDLINKLYEYILYKNKTKL